MIISIAVQNKITSETVLHHQRKTHIRENFIYANFNSENP